MQIDHKTEKYLIAVPKKRKKKGKGVKCSVKMCGKGRLPRTLDNCRPNKQDSLRKYEYIC